MTTHHQRQSYYWASANSQPQHGAVKGTHHCDVCIIGAGMTGLTAALSLAKRGFKVSVIDSQHVGFGASGRSGGQIIGGFNKSPGELVKMVGSSDAQALSAMAREAVADVKARVNDHAIACDLAHGHYHVGLKPRHDRELAEWIDEAVTFGDDQLQFINGSSVLEHVASPIYTSALFDPDGGHLHPLNYTLGLAEAALKSGVSIFENSPAQSICHRPKPQIKTAEGEITAEHLLICTNALIDGLEPMMDRMIMPVGTYIMATEPLDAPRANALIAGNAAVADINFVLNYFRLSGDHRMLFGGRVSYSKIDPRNIGAVMAQTLRHYFPQLVDTKVSYAWGGHVAITMNRLPQFGRLGPATYFAHGFSGHGVALTGLAGKLMAEAVAGSAERFDVFSRIPHRRFPGGRLLRTPALVLAMLYLRLRDML